ncbi:pantothenate transporter liz1 [Ophiostoma piceae UAMH 11346]|uniref:Pantothenate transporter liz1 n=1 Tax=Ophiostoma piceae (strain UAMH 11346) TaxID=1262450 RepID=S3CMW7_OPHP1|nr:pantothenate transporter liz1 [Ophiostoma piceae UAMH 11346]
MAGFAGSAVPSHAPTAGPDDTHGRLFEAVLKPPAVAISSATADTSPVGKANDTPEAQRTRRILAGIVWDSLDKSPEDRRLVAKIDWFILSYVCIAYFVKYLDQTNVSNAYVSGMKEDLGMHGNDLNLLTTYWTIGYILGQIPSQIIMTRVPPSVWLPSLELTWSLLVIGMAGAQDLRTLHVLRFFVGLLEASAYPGIMTLLGSWYRPEEQCKRACIYQASSSIAQMFGGYLQAALYRSMNGAHGLAAWRWLFVFDGVIGVPIALYGFFAIPNSPATTRARWLSPDERRRAADRMHAVGRSSVDRTRLSLRTLANIFREWPVYLFTASFVCYIQATRVYAYFNVWLKSTGRYSVEQVNTIPTAGFGLLVVVTLVFAWTSDGLQTRWPVIVWGASMSLAGAVVLSATVRADIAAPNHAAIMAGFFLTYLTTGTAGVCMTYMTEVLSYNYLHRAVVIAIADTAAYAFVAWLPLVIFNTGEAPFFHIGYKMTAVFLSLQIVFILLVPVAQKRWPVGQYEDRRDASPGTEP